MTVLGKLLEFAVDASLVSTALSFTRRATGYRVPTAMIASPPVRKYVEKYLQFGEGLSQKCIHTGCAFNNAYKTHPLGDATAIAFAEAAKAGWVVPADGVK